MSPYGVTMPQWVKLSIGTVPYESACTGYCAFTCSSCVISRIATTALGYALALYDTVQTVPVLTQCNPVQLRTTWSILFNVMVCRLLGTKLLFEPMLTCWHLGLLGTNLMKCWSNSKHYLSRKYIWKCRLPNGRHADQSSVCLNIIFVMHKQTFCKFWSAYLVKYHPHWLWIGFISAICYPHKPI